MFPVWEQMQDKHTIPLTPDQKKLVEDHVGVVRIVARKFSHWGVFDGDDAIQAGMVGLIKAAKKFGPHVKYSFSAYAGMAIKNSIIDLTLTETRRNRTSSTVPISSFNGAMELVDVNAPDPSDPIESTLLQSRLSRLTDLQRRVINLTYYDQLDPGEISRTLGISNRLVAQIIEQSLAIMREEVPQLLEQPSRAVAPIEQKQESVRRSAMPEEKEKKPKGRPEMLLVCDKYPGQKFTVKEAADKEGVSRYTIHSGMKRGVAAGKNGAVYRRTGEVIMKIARPADSPLDLVIARTEKKLAAMMRIREILVEYPEIIGEMNDIERKMAG